MADNDFPLVSGWKKKTKRAPAIQNPVKIQKVGPMPNNVTKFEKNFVIRKARNQFRQRAIPTAKPGIRIIEFR